MMLSGAVRRATFCGGAASPTTARPPTTLACLSARWHADVFGARGRVLDLLESALQRDRLVERPDRVGTCKLFGLCGQLRGERFVLAVLDPILVLVVRFVVLVDMTWSSDHASQTRAVLSLLTITTHVPSLENAQHHRSSVCPSSVFCSVPVLASPNRAVLSLPAVTTRVPSP